MEVIVVDDGSTDDTRERVAKYAERVQYFRDTVWLSIQGRCRSDAMPGRNTTGHFGSRFCCRHRRDVHQFIRWLR